MARVPPRTAYPQGPRTPKDLHSQGPCTLKDPAPWLSEPRKVHLVGPELAAPPPAGRRPPYEKSPRARLADSTRSAAAST